MDYKIKVFLNRIIVEACLSVQLPKTEIEICWFCFHTECILISPRRYSFQFPQLYWRQKLSIRQVIFCIQEIHTHTYTHNISSHFVGIHVCLPRTYERSYSLKVWHKVCVCLANSDSFPCCRYRISKWNVKENFFLLMLLLLLFLC